jgi:secreted trypsin-like serine protease
MLRRIVIVLCALAAASPAQAVVGGHETAPGAWPFAAALVEHSSPDARSGQFCGATLIAPRLALTAAHCVTRPGSAQVVTRRLDLIVGQHRLGAGKRGRAAIVEIRVHPGYSPTTFAWDAALVRLARPLSAAPATLPDSLESSLAPGTALVAVGWGATNLAGSSFPDALREASLQVQPDDSCRATYGSDFDSTSVLCAGIESGGVDTCDGDSGGPLLLPDASGGILIGITSFGGACGAADTPGGYTRVSALVPWLAAKAPTDHVRTLQAYSVHGAIARKRPRW